MKSLSKSRKSLFSLMLATLVALFFVGCGSSGSDDLVNVNGTNDQAGGVGILEFRFQAATAQTTLPAGVATVRFDFYTSETPSAETLAFTEARAFSELITFSVSPANRSVVVTPFDANNNRLAGYFGSFTVIVEGTVDVALQDIGEVTFEAAASPTTLRTGVNTITYQGLAGTTNSPIQQIIPESELTFSIASAPNGVTIATNGDITVPSNAVGSVVVEVAFTNGNETLTDNVTFVIP